MNKKTIKSKTKIIGTKKSSSLEELARQTRHDDADLINSIIHPDKKHTKKKKSKSKKNSKHKKQKSQLELLSESLASGSPVLKDLAKPWKYPRANQKGVLVYAVYDINGLDLPEFQDKKDKPKAAIYTLNPNTKKRSLIDTREDKVMRLRWNSDLGLLDCGDYNNIDMCLDRKARSEFFHNNKSINLENKNILKLRKYSTNMSQVYSLSWFPFRGLYYGSKNKNLVELFDKQGLLPTNGPQFIKKTSQPITALEWIPNYGLAACCNQNEISFCLDANGNPTDHEIVRRQGTTHDLLWVPRRGLFDCGNYNKVMHAVDPLLNPVDEVYFSSNDWLNALAWIPDQGLYVAGTSGYINKCMDHLGRKIEDILFKTGHAITAMTYIDLEKMRK
ncbi:WD40 repeat domain-containing protein [Candidatus Woesearchaeota archaeon]|jgi:WD40 repeat protein|nr:WD40 repeat domain-containing protein [Candidatus Woesearchaeota archaeon]MBT6519674.1 WD40 repeat domain-containing protein [Candidatus Woesearchaeota archaeon]MBT7367365.1 WD40 repeat domain-containing protein [Candidatus Woesearchaeota archaeon]